MQWYQGRCTAYATVGRGFEIVQRLSSLHQRCGTSIGLVCSVRFVSGIA